MEPADYAPISALQHLMVCERQAALIHVERLWLEDSATAVGRVVHERADDGGLECRAGVRSVRGLRLVSNALRLQGRADLVEIHSAPRAIIPVEYKRGSSAFPLADAVQVCAQALCLEEMHEEPVSDGAVFRAKGRKRVPVPMTPDLRATTLRAIARLHEIIDSLEVPPPILKPVCAKCSLAPMCLPQALSVRARGSRYLQRLFEEEGGR
jgi:CRISPR-associated exonuclease Cas4